MKLTRYEVFQKGTSLNVGFMRALDKMDVPFSDEKKLLSPFDFELPIPDSEVFQNPKATSYFTEDGIEYFGEAIEKLVSYINNFDKGQFEVSKKEIDIEVEEDQILYGDSMQMIIEVN